MPARAWHLARMLRHERESANKIRELQSDGFVALFEHAYQHVPFYRDLYRVHGIGPGDVRSLDDIGRLPVVSRRELQTAAAAGTLWPREASTLIESCTELSTSGTSGQPFRFYVTR